MMTGQDYVTDSERAFYLVYGPAKTVATEPTPYKLMRTDRSDAAILPIPPHSSGGRFYLFDRVFYIYQSVITDNDDSTYSPSINPFKVWRENNCWPFWRVTPETARTETNRIPYGPWVGKVIAPARSTAAIDILPTKRGIFFTFSRREGVSGLYALKPDSTRQLVSGIVRNAIPSPDGCRLAFEWAPGGDSYAPRATIPPSIVAVDLCMR
jgi:hypothetical protein